MCVLTGSGGSGAGQGRGPGVLPGVGAASWGWARAVGLATTLSRCPGGSDGRWSRSAWERLCSTAHGLEGKNSPSRASLGKNYLNAWAATVQCVLTAAQILWS